MVRARAAGHDRTKKGDSDFYPARRSFPATLTEEAKNELNTRNAS